MIDALWTGISGLSSAQTAIDNESNNIANVNTVGYKASRVNFADLMYQDSIGKGSTVTSAEKQYTQGSLNLTGSSYDMALNGEGFFVVSDVSSTGTSEDYYTRAGNFRMGENGTLQDASGNEVQGWAMSAIDSTSDVTSTNDNLTFFTSDFTSIAGNQIVQYTNKVETYAAKMTDYSTSAESDAEELTGSGVKSASDKIADIEALITAYTDALSSYALDPDATSTPSIAQSSSIDYPSTATSILTGEGDQIYVYIDGNKITQDYVSVTTTEDLTSLDLDGDGTSDAADDSIVASRIATYKALADEISSTTGLNAYTVDAADSTGVASTYNADVELGIIRIDSINPGESFTIGDIAEVSGSTEADGDLVTITEAVAGTGEAAVESAMVALKNAVAGSQQDVYEEDDVFSDDDGVALTFAASDTVTFTLEGVTITSTFAAGTNDTFEEVVDDMVSQINLDTDLQLLVEATNVNGMLMITSIETGEEFSGIVEYYNDASTTTYTKEKDDDISGNTGAAAEFMQIVSTVDQTTSQGSLQLKLDTLALTDSSFGEFSVDDSGLITMKQDGVEFVIGQVAIAQFNNNIGLEAIGDNLLAKTNDSGDPLYSVNNENSTSIEAETLELSTADLSESLVNLMVFQRAFEANAKSITTADELLTTLIGLKR